MAEKLTDEFIIDHCYWCMPKSTKNSDNFDHSVVKFRVGVFERRKTEKKKNIVMPIIEC